MAPKKLTEDEVRKIVQEELAKLSLPAQYIPYPVPYAPPYFPYYAPYSPYGITFTNG